MVEWIPSDSSCVATRHASVRSVGFRVSDHPRAMGRMHPFSLDGIPARDGRSRDLIWLRDESLKDSANLPDPHVLAEEIADDLQSPLEQIESALGDLTLRANASELPSG